MCDLPANIMRVLEMAAHPMTAKAIAQTMMDFRLQTASTQSVSMHLGQLRKVNKDLDNRKIAFGPAKQYGRFNYPVAAKSVWFLRSRVSAQQRLQLRAEAERGTLAKDYFDAPLLKMSHGPYTSDMTTMVEKIAEVEISMKEHPDHA